jgi:hypothetical protein
MKRYESIARALIFAIRELVRDSNMPSSKNMKARIYIIPNCEATRELLELPDHQNGVLGTEITTSISAETLNLAPSRSNDRSVILSEHPFGKIMGFSYASHPNSLSITDAKFELVIELSDEENTANTDLSKLADKAIRNILPFMRNGGYSSYCPI